MCWVGKIENKHTAKNNIKTFKVCRITPDKKIKPYYKINGDIKIYKEGETYYSPFGVAYTGSDYIKIDAGLHSYEIYNESIGMESYFTYNELMVIKSSTSYEGVNARIVLCTIPKGSKYFINDEGEIVSNCIVINKVIKSRVTYDNIKKINDKIINFKLHDV